MVSSEWERLMAAPWGKTSPEANEQKRVAVQRFDDDTKRFWKDGISNFTGRPRNLPVPTFQSEVRPQATLVQCDGPLIGNSFMANDDPQLKAKDRIIRCTGGRTISKPAA